MRTTLLLLALVAASCKLGPFPDEPVQRPEAPLPSGWNGPEGVGQTDAGVSNDASVPAAEPGK
jgi:hypothetical protein